MIDVRNHHPFPDTNSSGTSQRQASSKTEAYAGGDFADRERQRRLYNLYGAQSSRASSS